MSNVPDELTNDETCKKHKQAMNESPLHAESLQKDW